MMLPLNSACRTLPVPAAKLPVSRLNDQRRRAVELRLAGHKLEAIHAETGLSVPTIVQAYAAFREGGWTAVPVRRGVARSGRRPALTAAQEDLLRSAVTGAPPPPALGALWSAAAVQRHAAAALGVALAPRSVGRCLERWGLKAAPATPGRGAGQFRCWAAGTRLLMAQDSRGALRWRPVASASDAQGWIDLLAGLLAEFPGDLSATLSGVQLRRAPRLAEWAAAQAPRLRASGDDAAAPAPLPSAAAVSPATPPTRLPTSMDTPSPLTHLQRLEAESIHILREVVAECENPVMLYSIGKDSACMLHLAKKAFWPAPPPFPLLHVDTTWKFRDMYAMRERMAKEMGMELLVYQNPEAKELGINPFTHGSQIHTDMWKTQGLKQALDKYGFDAAFGGARRDEEKSRAKERIFSFRTAEHRWDPKNQRPELWKLYNTRHHKGESIRVFPISNWTELDIWQYIHLENIPIVPLYFSRERPVVERDGTLIMVDDERMPLRPNEVPMMKKVRFRTLGCYPLTGAVESEADTLPAIIQEMLLTKTSERQGRMIDHDTAASMEKKKQEGYF
jgi:sulfate adenylyltransferase subunit 2